MYDMSVKQGLSGTGGPVWRWVEKGMNGGVGEYDWSTLYTSMKIGQGNLSKLF
jgi:hypothetical protein